MNVSDWAWGTWCETTDAQAAAAQLARQEATQPGRNWRIVCEGRTYFVQWSYKV